MWRPQRDWFIRWLIGWNRKKTNKPIHPIWLSAALTSVQATPTGKYNYISTFKCLKTTNTLSCERSFIVFCRIPHCVVAEVHKVPARRSGTGHVTSLWSIFITKECSNKHIAPTGQHCNHAAVPMSVLLSRVEVSPCFRSYQVWRLGTRAHIRCYL